MKINHIINETTTAGSVATVSTPLGGTQSRGNSSIYGGKKVGTLLKGKKTSKPYANSLNEAAMKDLAYDLQNMKPAEFQKKYGKTREEMKAAMSQQPKPAQAPVNEADLQEDDVILIPGQGRKMKTGFVPHGKSRVDHEVEMARSDLFSAAKNAQQVYAMIKEVSEDEGLEGWVQEKIIKANDYLNTIREYLEGKQVQGVAEELSMSHQRDHKTQKYPDNSNSLANRSFSQAERPNVSKTADGHPTVKYRTDSTGKAGQTRVEPSITQTRVKRKDSDRPVPSFLQKNEK
jgi:hypothetical protein